MVLDGFTMDAPKTKTIVELLKSLELSNQRVLLLVSESDANLTLSSRNVPKITAQSVNQTSSSDVLRAEALLCTRTAWDELLARVDGKGDSAEVAA
jgi:large subunit ribosomal protein L4